MHRVQLNDPENKATLDALLGKHDIKRDKRKGRNPWMPIVNLLFGSWTEGKDRKRKFKADRSAKKYAASFRFFQENNWEPDLIATHLEDDVKSNQGRKLGKGLVGTEKADKLKHSGEDPDELEVGRNRNWLWNNGKPLASISIADLTPRAREEHEFIALWGVRDGLNVNIYGEMVGAPYSRSVMGYMDKVFTELRKFGSVHLVQGKSLGAEVSKPKLVADNIVDPFSERVREILASWAVEGGDKHPQKDDPTLFGFVPREAPKKEEKLKRKGVKVGGKVKDVEKEAAHEAA